MLQVAVMRKRYQRTAAAMAERNKLLRETAQVHAAYLRLRGPFKQLAQQQRQARLDSWKAALQQLQQQSDPPLPTLQGLGGAAAAARPQQQGMAAAAAAAPRQQQQQQHDAEDDLFDDDDDDEDDEDDLYTRAPARQRIEDDDDDDDD
jgi:uncharacterized protein YecE (DUF72 family)